MGFNVICLTYGIRFFSTLVASPACSAICLIYGIWSFGTMVASPSFNVL